MTKRTAPRKTRATPRKTPQQRPPRKPRPTKRWFGLPRGVVLFGVLVGLGVFAGVFGPWAQPSDQVRAIVTGLRASSVYQAPGEPGVINAARARQVIGNRPIVVVLLDRTPLPPAPDHGDSREVLCDQIAKELTTDYIWVYAADDTGAYKGNDCYGANFPKPSKPGVSMDDFDIALNISAQQSAQFRVTDTDRNAEIEEFVLSFDATTGDDYGAVPTAGTAPDLLATQQIILAGLAMVFGTVAAFGLLRVGGLALRRNTARASARRTRQAELNARLNRIADAVLNPREHAHADDAERQAEVAKRYVLVLDQLEHAGNEAELTAAEREITALAGEVGE